MNGVACYTINGKTGLQAMNGTVRSLELNQTTPATGPAGSVSDVLFTEDGKKLLVSVKGSPPVQGKTCWLFCYCSEVYQYLTFLTHVCC